MPACAWSLYHANAALAYLAGVLVLTMACPQPVLALLSLAAAALYSLVLAGPAPTAKMLAWQLPLLLVIGLANPLFSAAGSTELFRIGAHAFYAEALAYGLTMGCMLVAVMLWFSNANRMLSSEQVLVAGARVAPVVSLMVSMVLRLVPQFVRRGTQVADAQRACTAASASATREEALQETLPRPLRRRAAQGGVAHAARQASVLMGWGMEDSLETADTLTALGWGSGPRSSYELQRLRRADGILIALVLVLLALSAICAVQIAGPFGFYPALHGWAAWPLYLPFCALLALPFLLELKAWCAWR